MRSDDVVAHPESTHHTDDPVDAWYDCELSFDLRHAAVAVPGPRTVDAVAQRPCTDVILDPDLREKSYGEAGGKPQSWLGERFVPPPEFRERMRHDKGVTGAETKWDLVARGYERASCHYFTSHDDGNGLAEVLSRYPDLPSELGS